jgi:hypothetical protein
MGSDPPGALGSNNSTPEKDDSSSDAEQEAGEDDMAEKDNNKEGDVDQTPTAGTKPGRI